MPEPIYNVRMQTVTTPAEASTTRTGQAKTSQEIKQEVQTVDVTLDDELDARVVRMLLVVLSHGFWRFSLWK